MKGPQLTRALEELGIDKDSFRVLGLLPLVFVAWADGTVHGTERRVIMRTARRKGWLEGRGETILRGWLNEAPDHAYVQKGLQVLTALAEDSRGLGASVPANTPGSLLSYCRDVAEAAGGIVSFWNPCISTGESEALADMASALGIPEGDSWQETVTRLEAEERTAPEQSGHRLLGVIPAVTDDPLGTLMEAYHAHGDLVRLSVPGQSVYMVTRPEHVQHILRDNMRNYQRGKDYRGLGGILGASLLTTEGEEWRILRRIAQPTFHRRMLTNFVSVMTYHTRRTLDQWETHVTSGEPLDIAEEMTTLTLRLIGELMFSEDLCDETQDIGHAVTTLIGMVAEKLVNPLRLPESIPTRKNQRLKSALHTFDKLIYKKIEARRRRTELGTDFLGMLTVARDPRTDEGLNDQQLRNEILTFLVAGHETTATALMWALYLASKHPLATRRVRKELQEAWGNALPTADMLSQCPYAKMFLDEAMRLYPPIPAFGRQAVAEDVIDGYTIEKNSYMALAPWVTHRLPDVWDNPEGFDPERFSPERSAGRHRDAFFPFASGPHKCIGAMLSEMEMKIIFLMILQRFDLNLVAGFEPQLMFHISLRSKNGMMMKVKPASTVL